jgi:hypothetical protein
VKQRIPIFLFIFLLSVTYGATVGFSQDNTRPAKGFSVVKRTIDVIGGMKKLKPIKNTQISSSIQRFEPQQTFSPGDAPMLVADIKRTLTNDLASHQTRTDWLVNAHYPASNTFKYTEIISGKDSTIFFLPPHRLWQ